MSKKTWAALLMSPLAASAVGCSDPPPTPTGDSGADVPVLADVADVPGDVGTDAPAGCPTVAFVRPVRDATLGASDDLDGMCSNGFTYNVQVATNAPDGTTLQLWVNGRNVASTTVSSPSITFPNVTLDVGALSSLEIRREGIETACGTTSVRVDCALPRCQITAPSGSTLLARDNAGTPGMFATDIVVGTNIEDGQPVRLALTGRTEPLVAMASGGTARFRNVALTPDGAFRARATCVARNNNTGTSAEVTWTVDSVGPSVEVQRPMAMSVIGLSGDVNTMVAGNQFSVCARSDAAGQRLCASVMGGTPVDPTGCAMVPSSSMTDACVEVTCPSGSAPFDVQVRTQDAAGNETTQTIAGIRCQSALPSVRVAAPAAYDPMNAMTILNASRDTNTTARGLQTEVVACTDRTAGEARLFVLPNSTAVATAMVAPVAMGDPCATLGMGFVGIARFPGVTLPESSPERTEPGSPAPTTPQVRVDVQDTAGDTGQSAATLFYVDSDAPLVSVANCGSLVRPGMNGSATFDVSGSSSAYPVRLRIERTGAMTQEVTINAPINPLGGFRQSVTVGAGTNRITATATDPAGNVATSASNCNVEVGNPPTLQFTAPMALQRFTVATGATTTITLRTDAPAGTQVTLTVGSQAPRTANVDAMGIATFSGVMLPEGQVVALSARTADVGGRGAGTASITVVVDTTAPAAPPALMGVVPTTPVSARRAGTVRLTWIDGSDSSTGTISRYELRTSDQPITADNFAMATVLPVAITPRAPGMSNTVDVTQLQLGRDNYFALRAFDVADNPSPTVAASAAVRVDVIVQRVDPIDMTTTGIIGSGVSGGSDVNGDGFADMVTGFGVLLNTNIRGRARIHLGSATGFNATNVVDIVGSSTSLTGLSAASVGDVNGDGIGDVVVGEGGPFGSGATAGRLMIFFGRRDWVRVPMNIAASSANVIIEGGTTQTVSGAMVNLATGSFARDVARVGDFDGDGINDIAATIPGARDVANNLRGAVVVFRGRRTWASNLTANDADFLAMNTLGESNFAVNLASGGRLISNDNRDDLVVGMGSGGSGNGRVFVFAGRDLTTPLRITNAAGAGTFMREGAMLNGSLIDRQYTGAGVGDVNGDGRADLAIGNGAGNAGGAILYYGSSDGSLVAGPVIPGLGANTAALGQRFAAVDFGLGRPSLLRSGATAADLVAGAGQAGEPTTGTVVREPRAYIWTGRSVWTGVTSARADREVTMTDGYTAPRGVQGVSWLGDIDGDGYVDLAYGSGSANPTLGTTGSSVYVIR
jgi:hypothetical protein